MTPQAYAEALAWTRDYIARYCIERGPMPGKMPGTVYAWALYLRRGLYDAEFLLTVAELMLHRIRAAHPAPFQLSGLETAAAPLLAGIGIAARLSGAPVNTFIVRKERKRYARENWIEGTPNALPVVLVDDLANSGGSLLYARNRCLFEGVPLAERACVIVNKYAADEHDADRATSDLYLPKSFTIDALFSLDDFGLRGASH